MGIHLPFSWYIPRMDFHRFLHLSILPYLCNHSSTTLNHSLIIGYLLDILSLLVIILLSQMRELDQFISPSFKVWTRAASHPPLFTLWPPTHLSVCISCRTKRPMRGKQLHRKATLVTSYHASCSVFFTS